MYFCAVFISAPNQVPPLEGAEEENGATNNAGKSKMAVKLSGLLELLMHSKKKTPKIKKIEFNFICFQILSL